MTIDEAIDVLKQYIKYNDGIPAYHTITEACKVAIDVIKPFEEGTKMATQELIEQGRNEAWEAASKLVTMEHQECNKVLSDHILTIDTVNEIFTRCTASEAINKLKAYEKQKKQKEDEIKVGDEVVTEAGDKGVVIGISNNDISLFMPAWNISQVTHKICCKKTGYHFPEISRVMEKLREGK